jgi:hypothetical protein
VKAFADDQACSAPGGETGQGFALELDRLIDPLIEQDDRVMVELAGS